MRRTAEFSFLLGNKSDNSARRNELGSSMPVPWHDLLALDSERSIHTCLAKRLMVAPEMTGRATCRVLFLWSISLPRADRETQVIERSQTIATLTIIQ